MIIQEPSTLAQLPSSVGDTSKETYVSQIYGLQGSRKRKRLEVAVAVNGEAVLIYNVFVQRYPKSSAKSMQIQAPKLLSSYAVPPQTNFTCKPCSVRLRRKTGSTVRRTFCALKRVEYELHSFLDSSVVPIPSSRRIELRDSKSPIVHLDVIPSNTQTVSSEEDVEVLAVHEDGAVEVFSGDLQSKRLKMSSNSMTQGQNPLEVRVASLVSFEDSRRTFFKDRADIAAELSRYSSDDQVDFSILLVIAALQVAQRDQSNNLQLKLFAVPHKGSPAPGSLYTREITELVHSTLPQSEALQIAGNFHAQYQPGMGTVLIRGDSTLITYGSLAFSPTILSKFDLLHAESPSFQYLSPYLLAEASNSGLTIFDTKYGTVQAKLDARSILHKVQKKKAATEKTPVLCGLSYFAKTKSVLALFGQSFVSFELSQSVSRGRELQERKVSLLDAIDRGTRQPSTHKQQTQGHKPIGFGQGYTSNGVENDEKWQAECLQMDRLVKAHNVAAFEEAMAIYLCEKQSHEIGVREIGGLKVPSQNATVEKYKISYLLSKIFDAEKCAAEPHTNNNNLKINFLPPRLLQWLIDSNYFTSTYVDRTIFGPSEQRPAPACVASTLILSDPSLQWLLVYLHHSPTIDLPDLMAILNLFVADAMTALQLPLNPSRMLTLTKNATQPETVGGMIYNEHEHDTFDVSTPAQTSRSKARSLDEARKETIILALERLSRHSKVHVTSTMQSLLTQENIFALIQFLRHELFMAGHTSHFRHQNDESLECERSIDLAMIIRTIACGIDALGPLSFVDSVVDGSFFASLIADLRDEISTALAGVEEALYLQGLLREVLRFGTSAVKYNVQRYSDSARLADVSEVGRQKPGTIVTVYSEPTDDQGNPDASTEMLPLSLQADELVSNIKRKGGGQTGRRSAREKAYLRRQREVGKYSFDRLIL